MKIKITLTFLGLFVIGILAFGSPPAAKAANLSENIDNQQTKSLNISEAAKIKPNAITETSPLIVMTENSNEAAIIAVATAPTLKNDGREASNSMAQVKATDGNSLMAKSNQNNIVVAKQSEDITGMK